MTFETMCEYLRSLNVEISPLLKAKFELYESLLIEWNEKINLTSILKPGEIYEKHFLDCLLLLKGCDFSNKKVVDIGSGAGFPGVVLALSNKEAKVTLVDSTAKKFKFLEELKKQLQINNIFFHIGRVEDMKKEKGQFDIVTSRGFSSLPTICEVGAPLLKEKGILIAMKSLQGKEELNGSDSSLAKLGLELDKTLTDTLPESKSTRVNFYFKKNKKSQSRFPRRWNDIISNPLW